MGILDKFEKICAIEHCSFDALKLRDYLVEFAKSYGYSVEIDEFDNVNYSNKGLEFAGKILDTIQHNIDTFTEDKDYAINIENVPGESANVKLCKKDHDLFETDLYLKIFEDNKFLNNL